MSLLFPPQGSASQTTLIAVKSKTDIIGASVALETAGNLAAVKAKTDLIPADIAARISTDIPAIKARTDSLPGRYYKLGAALLLNSGETYTTNTAYVKLSTIRVGNHANIATLRISFNIRINSSGITAYGCIYRNGVAVGTARSTTSLSYVNFTEDIAGWTAGDTCELWGYTSNSGVAAYYNVFGIKGILAFDFAFE